MDFLKGMRERAVDVVGKIPTDKIKTGLDSTLESVKDHGSSAMDFVQNKMDEMPTIEINVVKKSTDDKSTKES